MIKCTLCGSSDLSKTLVNRDDFEFNLPIKLNYYKCNNSLCEFVFSYPSPSIEEIKSFYEKYSTHTSNQKPKILNLFARLIEVYRLNSLLLLLRNKNKNSIKILDFGCGNGNLLFDLKKLGFNKLFGYDFDTKAISEMSKSNKIMIIDDFDEITLNGNFDYIFLNHVIEHLADAKSILEQLSFVLNDNGKIIIRTPNSNSFLAKIFGNSWRGWETPRHLGIYNYANIDLLSNSLKINKKWTSNIMFSGLYHGSIKSRFFNETTFGKIIKHLTLPAIYLFAIIINSFLKNLGEEVCIVYSKSK